MKTDIENIEDIKLFVDTFYAKIRNDDLLAPIFIDKIKGDWQPHLDKMYLFWNAAIFGEKGYVGNPFLKHNNLIVDASHFERWLQLFNQTIDNYFIGTLAETTKWRASVMADNFHRRISLIIQAQKQSL
jgi:hemoglobin